MRLYAEAQFRLAKPQEDGKSLRDHLENYERQTGRRHPLLAAEPSLHPGLKLIWSDFLDLHSTRPVQMGEPRRITYSELESWSRVRGVRLERWEIDAIRAADQAYLLSLKESREDP